MISDDLVNQLLRATEHTEQRAPAETNPSYHLFIYLLNTVSNRPSQQIRRATINNIKNSRERIENFLREPGNEDILRRTG